MLKESMWASIVTTLGQKACLHLLQDFSKIKICGKWALRNPGPKNFHKTFRKDPFANEPISELLNAYLPGGVDTAALRVSWSTLPLLRVAERALMLLPPVLWRQCVAQSEGSDYRGPACNTSRALTACTADKTGGFPSTRSRKRGLFAERISHTISTISRRRSASPVFHILEFGACLILRLSIVAHVCGDPLSPWMSTDGVLGWQGFFFVFLAGWMAIGKWSAGLQLSWVCHTNKCQCSFCVDILKSKLRRFIKTIARRGLCT